MRLYPEYKTFALLLAFIATLAVPAESQQYWGGVTFKRLFLDYQTLNGGDFGAFRDYTDGLEFSYILPLNDELSINVPVKIGMLSTDGELENVSVIGLDVHANYHFRTTERIFRPYALLGLGGVMEGMDSVNLQVPIGGGFDLEMFPNAYFTWQSEFRYSTAEDRNNFNHSVGLKYMFGAPVDEEVPLDSDEDGVLDEEDECPLVPGIRAFNGCPDSDNDGIRDQEDACPEYPGLPEFDGCPDTDGDGVPDTDDECPNEAGPADNNGCPIQDSDGDGVIDDEDDCPDVAGLRALDGCPDRDGDGIADASDDCPDDAGEARYNGCPDTDDDGVPDPDDLCPNTKGPVSNDGCPVIEQEDKETLDFAMQAVQFEHGSARLTDNSYRILNQVIDIMNKYPEYRLEISGHTDNTGSEEFNQKLSEARAKACFDFLRIEGISVRRLSYVGHGEAKPIADNDTHTGRQLNRRVEFNLIPGLD